MLTLFEELFLLAVHEEKGSVISTTERKLDYGISGSILSELALRGKVRAEESHRLEVIDPAPTGDTILDSALEEIKSSTHPRKLAYWLKTFHAGAKKLRKRTAKSLVAKGLLVEEDSRWMWVIPTADHPDSQASAKYWLKAHLRELVLACSGAAINDLALLSLMKSTGLLYLVFTKDERKLAQQRIYQMLIEKAFADPVAQTLEEIERGVGDLLSAD